MTRHPAALLPPLLLALSIGSASRAWGLAGALAALAIALYAIGPRLSLDAGRQALTTVVGGAAGWLLAMLLHEHVRGALTENWTRIASALALAAAARFSIAAARGGSLPAVALVFAGLVATGRTHHAPYTGIVVAYLLSSVWVLASAPGVLPPDGATRWRRRAWGGAILLVSAALAASATLSVQYLLARSGSRMRYTSFTYRPRVGFGERMELGALSGMLDSDERVLRVRGPRADYLRGVSLDVYESGRWRKSDAAAEQHALELGGEIEGSGRVIVEHLKEGSRFFAPLEARSLVTAPPSVVMDGMSALAATSRSSRLLLSFSPGEPDGLRAPRQSDRMLPRRLRPRLMALAAQWTEGASSPAEELLAIERRLRTEFAYSLVFERRGSTDPVMDFLFEDRRGHCEYFASALALLARARGIPTRIVMGYRVGERSPFGYYLVRERNAHAWVEAWLPGEGWTTRDATPMEALPQNIEHEARLAFASVDAIGMAYDRMTTWLEELTLAETALAWTLALSILALIVARGVRRRTRGRAPDPDELALPFLDALLARLARGGHAHHPDETLERLARRVPDAAARELLSRYAALRYGDIGDAAELARDVAAHTGTRQRH